MQMTVPVSTWYSMMVVSKVLHKRMCIAETPLIGWLSGAHVKRLVIRGGGSTAAYRLGAKPRETLRSSGGGHGRRGWKSMSGTQGRRCSCVAPTWSGEKWSLSERTEPTVELGAATIDWLPTNRARYSSSKGYTEREACIRTRIAPEFGFSGESAERIACSAGHRFIMT
jgi:hypothetical protein